MPRKIPIFFFSLAVFGLLVAAGAAASSPFDIEFPIAELGGCADKDACRAYCDDPGHGAECLAFAKKHGLVDEKTAAKAEAVQTEGGPGGCSGADECRAYCDDPSRETECVEYAVNKGFMTRAEADRILKPGPGGCRGRQCQQYCSDPAHEEECFEYAADNGFIPKAEAEKIRQFKKKFQQEGGGPGGCQSEQECRGYCDDAGHINECVSFAEENGFIDKDHARVIKKTLGTGPGGCKGAEQCREFCENPGNQPQCIDFAAENGFMSPEEAERARKFAGKTGPGGCQGEQCRDFCENPDNTEQCLTFAESEGLIPPQELARARKFMQASRDGGPGGCRGRQCQQYCGDPAHQDECFGFAKEQGLISAEEEKEFEAGMKIQQVVQSSGGPGGCKSDEECREYCTDAAHVEECIAFGATHGGVPPEQVREMLKHFTEQRFEAHGGFSEFGPGGFEDFSKFEGDAQRRFEEFRQLEEHFRGSEGGFPGGFPGGPGGFPGGPGGFPGGFPGGQGGAEGDSVFTGPGGCTSPAECIQYCTAHKDECFGGPPPSGAGRGGGGEEGGFFPGGGAPQLRTNIIHEFNPDELPEGFQQLPPEERQQFFNEQFPQFNPPSPGQFPGRGIEGFPGHGGEFPGRAPEGFPGRGIGGFPGGPGEFPGRPPQEFPGGESGGGFPGGFVRPENMPGHMDESGHPFSPGEAFTRPPEGGSQPSSGGSFPSPSGEGSFHPPEGSFRPTPEGSFTRPSSGTFSPPPPSSGSFTQPSSGTFSPPPPSGSFEQQSVPPPPSGSFEGQHIEQPHSRSPLLRFFGTVLEGFAR